MDIPFLTSYEQTLVNYWVEAGQVTQTANGPVALTWQEISAWADEFYSEQYVEYVENRRPLRSDGQPDERFKVTYVPLLVKQRTLLDWEIQTIRRLSAEYVAELANTAIDAPCPKEVIIDDLTEEAKLDNAKALGDSLKSMFGVIKSSAKKTPAVEAATN